MKTICLDYDGTYTVFPELLDMIIDYGKKKDIRIILATMRRENEYDSVLKDLESRIEVFYTGRKAKRDFLMDLGIIPDIWIDDNPEWIFKDSR